MKNIEKTALALFLLVIVLNRLDESLKDTAILFKLFLCLMYAIAGYFFFCPPKEVRFGKAIAIVNGLSLTVNIFFIFSFISAAFIILREAWIIVLFFFVLHTILFFILYAANKNSAEHRWYLKGMALRNAIPLFLLMFPVLLPNRTRALLFYGPESTRFYKVTANELINKAYQELDHDKAEAAKRTAVIAAIYANKGGDNSDELYQSALLAIGYSAYVNKNYSTADSSFHKVILLQSVTGNNDCYKKAVYYSGLNYSKAGYYTLSDSLLNASLQVIVEPLTRGNIFNTMGYNATRTENRLKADSLFEQALTQYQKAGPDNMDDCITTMENRADNYTELNRFSASDSLYHSALKLTLEHFGEVSVHAATIYSALANLYSVLGNYQQAKTWCTKSLEIHKSLSGTKSPGYLYVLNKLVSIRIKLSDYHNAGTTLYDLLATVDTDYSPGSALAAMICDNLAHLNIDFADYGQAEEYAERSLRVKTFLFGDNSLQTSSSFDTRAYLYYCTGNYTLADSLYARALEIKYYYKGRENRSYVQSLNGIGLVYVARGFFGKADTLFTYTRKITDNLLGTQHPDYAIILNNIGCLRIKQKQFDRADSCFREAMAINSQHFGNVHLNLAENLKGLGDVNVGKKLYTEAKEKYTKALLLYKTLFSFSHPESKLLEEKIKKLP